MKLKQQSLNGYYFSLLAIRLFFFIQFTHQHIESNPLHSTNKFFVAQS